MSSDSSSIIRELNLIVASSSEKDYTDAVNHFLKRFGSILASVHPFHQSSSGYNSAELKSALQHCVNLKRIDLSGQGLKDDALDVMVDMFKKGYCSKLGSLNLDRNDFGYESLGELAWCLSDPSILLVLRELHIVGRYVDSVTLESFREMLQVNKTLRVVHLPGPFWQLQERLPAESVKRMIHEQFQGERLPLKLALDAKLALLSVLRHPSSKQAAASAQYKLDSLMVATIFRFAADSVKRRIMWDQCA